MRLIREFALKCRTDPKTRRELLLLAAALIYGLMFLPAIIIQDDLKFAESVGSLKDILKLVYSQYYTWTSRVVINTVWYLVLRFGKAAWALYMAVSAYVLLKALMMLSGREDEDVIPWLCVTLLMLFPGVFFVTAGWIATTTSYFGPQAFGVMAVVPLKKCLCDEKISLPEGIFYAFCMVYAANAEQMCVVLLGLYLAAAVYFIAVRKPKPLVWVMLALALAGFIFMMTCPGNWSRKDQEILRYFPTYNMLGFIDKLDIGISTTLHWMFAEGSAAVWFICLMLTFLVWKRYREVLFRCLSVLPLAVITFAGPLKQVPEGMFPYASFISHGIEYYGAFTAAENGAGVGRIQFALFLFTALCIVLEIILLNDTPVGLASDLLLIGLGIGSRVMMAFSPTVYMSNVRTYSTLVVCLFMFAVRILAHNPDHVGERERNYGKVLMACVILFGVVDLACLAATYGHS